jgi:hypothetical protein
MELDEKTGMWRMTGTELLAQFLDDWQQFKGYEDTSFEDWCRPTSLREIKIDGHYLVSNELHEVHEIE